MGDEDGRPPQWASGDGQEPNASRGRTLSAFLCNPLLASSAHRRRCPPRSHAERRHCVPVSGVVPVLVNLPGPLDHGKVPSFSFKAFVPLFIILTKTTLEYSLRQP